MTRADIQHLLQRHQDALNRHDVEALAAMYASAAVLESPMFSMVRGRKAIAESFQKLFELFPDYAITMRDPLFICEGDRAAEFSTVTGTQRVSLYGLPPSRHSIEYEAARLFSFRDGLIAHEHRIYDFGGVLERLEKTRLDHELGVASAVQQTLMANPVSRGGFFEAVGASLPCRTIGGDFLEYSQLGPDRLGLALGDVSGKGPAAALIAAMLQGMFSMLPDAARMLTSTLTQLNIALHRRGIEPRYATVVYGVLTADGTLTYANAGHTPPLLISRHQTRWLDAGGPILGVFEEAAFPSETILLEPGDTFLTYSDGVTDAVSPTGEDFGMDRLFHTAKALSGRPPHDVVTGLLDAVRAFCGEAAPTDDATVAVLRYGRDTRPRRAAE